MALSTHSFIYPRFTIIDKEAIKPHLDGMVEATKAEAGCLFYGWTICGDKLQCRETYVDGAAVNTHLASAGPLVGKMLDAGVAKLDSIGIMGSEEDIAVCKEAGDGLGCAYWKNWASFTNIKLATAETVETKNFLVLQPTFTIVDQAKAEPFMQRMVEATREKEREGCMYYGWNIMGDKLFCREAYIDGASVVKHIQNAGPIVGEMLDSGAAKLDGIELHGPAAEIAVAKEECDKLGCTYWETYATWSKFSMVLQPAQGA